MITTTPLPAQYLGLPCKHCTNLATVLLIEHKRSSMALCDDCAAPVPTEPPGGEE
jgi:hypothetical protein